MNPHPDFDGPRFRELLPKLYYVGQKSTIFNWTNYFLWVLIGSAHSVVIFVMPYYVFDDTILTPDGKNVDLWIFSITSFHKRTVVAPPFRVVPLGSHRSSSLKL